MTAAERRRSGGAGGDGVGGAAAAAILTVGRTHRRRAAAAATEDRAASPKRARRPTILPMTTHAPAGAAPSPTKPHDNSVIDTLQSLIVAFVLAMTFRGFVAEGFVIPTNQSPCVCLHHLRAQSLSARPDDRQSAA